MPVTTKPFRNHQRHHQFTEAVRGYDNKSPNYFNVDGTRNTNNGPAGYFWRGYDLVGAHQWDHASKQTTGYVYWRAGQACRRNWVR